jgi:hypothetical protein
MTVDALLEVSSGRNSPPDSRKNVSVSEKEPYFGPGNTYSNRTGLFRARRCGKSQLGDVV